MTSASQPSPSSETVSEPPTPHAVGHNLFAGDRLRALVAMYVGYAMFMVLRMVPTVAGTSITSDPVLGITTGDWGRIIAVGTIGAMIGKFIGGYAADRIGGRLTFAIGLILSGIGVTAFAFSRTVIMFQAAFFVTLMAKAAGWPSMTQIIVTTFDPGQYGRVWGVLSTSSRVGTLVATFCLGGLLSLLEWRWMLIASGITGVLMAAVFFGILKPRRRNPVPTDPVNDDDGTVPADIHAGHPLHGTVLGEAIVTFLTSLQFWLITISLMGLTIVWDFLLIVPQYLNQTLGMNPAEASVASSAFPLGSLISVLCGGFVFDTLSRRRMAWVMALLLLVTTLCIASLLWLPELGLSPLAAQRLSMGQLFVIGLCVSPCYYIPMSVFSLEFGGPHSGFLVASLDALAFGGTAAFYYFGGDIAERSWPQFLWLLTAVCAIAAVATWIFMLGEARRRASGR